VLATRAHARLLLTKPALRSDDQQDYFQTDGSQWMTPEQRKQMKKLEEERRKQREDAKSKVSISFDFAGRRVMVEEGNHHRSMQRASHRNTHAHASVHTHAHTRTGGMPKT
jgi:hypothetical protein